MELTALLSKKPHEDVEEWSWGAMHSGPRMGYAVRSTLIVFLALAQPEKEIRISSGQEVE
jgi:hypothetical protein